jgi:hypothetical protein
MRRFVLDEISAVDTPAQKGAVMTIMKRGDVVINPEGTDMTPVQKLARQMAALDAKLDAILKAQPTEYEFDANEVEKAGVSYQGKPHRGDWPPGSDTPGPGNRPPKGTRADDYVSDDESDDHGGAMTPERASQILQPYADHSVTPEEDDPQTESDELYARLGDDEDEKDEVLSRVAAKADSLMKRDPRMSPRRAQMMAAGRVVSEYEAEASSFAKRVGEDYANRLFGREREYAKRADAAARQSIRKGYSDRDLFKRLANRFGADAVARQFGFR